MKKGARVLRVWRAERDITQTKLARRAGLSAARYWQIENGEGSEPKPDEKSRVAAVLGVQVSDIAWPAVERRQVSA
jgi:transcriptional regulator with XRE-family HTH domain